MRRLYKTCTKLVIEGCNHIEPGISRKLMKASQLLEGTNDRAFIPAGYYPLTPGTIGPVGKRDSLCD